MYINDMLIIGLNSKDIAEIKKALIKEFKIDDIRPVTYFLKVRIVQNRANRSIALI